VPTPASSTSTPTGGSTPSSSPPAGEEKSESKAWIAGAVVGPLVGLALIGFGIFFFMRRKKNRNTSRNVAPASGSIPAPGVSAYQQNAYPTNPGSPAQPQYYDHPNMSQTGAAAPYDPHKQSAYYPHGPQSPNSQGSHSPYGTAPQPWQQGVQPVYEAPSSAMSPQLQSAQLAQYQHNAPQHFSNELEGSNPHGQPGMTNVREMR
jgi:LPXTG-motif cell wall-anchored protein